MCTERESPLQVFHVHFSFKSTTTHKLFCGCVGSHTLFECVVNATRLVIMCVGSHTLFERGSPHFKSCDSSIVTRVDYWHNDTHHSKFFGGTNWEVTAGVTLSALVVALLCVCVCVSERERERRRESTCPRRSTSVCVCVCQREREREKERVYLP